MERMACDVLVIGSGGAGLRAAIAAREKGADVCVISKAPVGKGTCTIMSAGVFAGTPEEGPRDPHIEKTLLAGRGINEMDLVKVLAEEAPIRLRELVAWGMKGRFLEGYLFAEAIPSWGGQEIIRCLLEKAREMGVQFKGGMSVSSLSFDDGSAAGMAYSTVQQKWMQLNAGAIVLATGGAGGLYLQHDNPQGMMGEAYALALDAGAVLQDMEFVQFYPLGLSEPGFPRYLIPPRLGDYGRLYNHREEEILDKYGIEERPAAELARDRLSQVLFKEVLEEKNDIWLDLTQISEELWCSDPFSASSWEPLGQRYGARRRPVRVMPMAHHVMGGIRIDPEGSTGVPGFYAAGEVSGGLHGANRLGGNALTETLVFGARAGAKAGEWAKDHPVVPSVEVEMVRGFSDEISGTGNADPSELKKRLRQVMWEKGGIIRNRQRLSLALTEVAELEEKAGMVRILDDPSGISASLELCSGIRTARMILQSALKERKAAGRTFEMIFPSRMMKHGAAT
ncbi:MAG: FAD-dependent oxidoreductase [Deltaproteobacteria bacterium]|nr:FAD-dependent oxidoreductase [Deltaproteobacteria bacterium]